MTLKKERMEYYILVYKLSVGFGYFLYSNLLLNSHILFTCKKDIQNHYKLIIYSDLIV